MRLRTAVFHALFTVFVLTAARPAHADPISITGGSATIWWDMSTGSFELFGDALHATVGGTAGVTVNTAEGPGGATTSFNGGIGSNYSYQGLVVLGDTQYTIPGYTLGPVWTGHIGFSTTSFVLPITTDSLVRISTPFTMSGTLSAAESSLPNAPQLFSVDVTGSGIASATLMNHVLEDGSNFFTLRSGGVSYSFQAASAPSATPEPTTLILTLTALAFPAAVLRRRWRVG